MKIGKYLECIYKGHFYMGARLRIFLTGEQERNLLKLRAADVPQKVKDRAEVSKSA